MSEAISKNEYMRELLYYIENNISSDLGTGLLSSIGYASRPKLYRSFYDLTGHSIKEYVRKRRLSNALALIKTSDMTITDIAFKCGYSSHQALCRAVRRSLGLTPSEYKEGDTYYFFPPFSGEPLQSVTVSMDTIPQTLRVLYLCPKLKNIEDVAVATFLRLFPDYGGRIFGRNGENKENRFCYELYLTDTEIDYRLLEPYGFKIEGESSCFTSLFAAAIVQNDEPKINSAWNYLYSEWLQDSMFEYSNRPYYEEYIIKNGRAVKLKLYLPIRERAGDTRIVLTDNPEMRFIVSKARGYNAEKVAAKAVIDYLKEHFPHIIFSSKDIYIRKEANSYVCGVRAGSEHQIEGDENVSLMSAGQGKYLVLESGVMGDYDRYAAMLTSFARDNGMCPDEGGLFAVYNAGRGFKNLSTKMYCPVKIVTK